MSNATTIYVIGYLLIVALMVPHPISHILTAPPSTTISSDQHQPT